MKFAEYLAENLVPEWRDKYLDYKGGKKKIKKVAFSPLNIIKSHTTQGQASTSATPGLPRTRTRATSNASFELPPAALTPKMAAGTTASQVEEPNNRTPLLQAQREMFKSTGSSNELRRVHSRNLNPPATYSGGSAVLNEGIPLSNMNDTITKEFIEWLDSELNKIENFYKEREDHCVTRYLLIQDQMFHLREEKLRLKTKNNKHPEELIKLGLAKTTKGLSKLNKYELPSLPRGLFRKREEETDKAANRRDYEQHKHVVPYYVARRQLKAAVQEHYRELELLKSYRMLNRTGFRKLVKKFDKRLSTQLSPIYMDKVNRSYFASSDVLDNLIQKVEDLYSTNFEEGNRKVAVEKLRSNLSEDHFHSAMFNAGLLYGLSIPLFAYALYFGVHKTVIHEIPEGRYLLQIWAGFFMLLLMAMLFSINCLVWSKYKVNYRFIFEFNQKTALNFRQYPLLPALFFFAFSLFAWFSFNDFWPHKLPGRFWPWFFFVFSVVVLFNPFNVLYLESRKWLIITIWRLFLSGFYPVEFKDFFFGDILCSLSYTMGNISFFFCIYATGWDGAADGSSKCGSSRSHLMGFFSALPPIWRFMQCIRRYADSGDWFPHLANMMKYAVTMVYYLTLSVYRIDSTLSHRALFIFFAIVNSIYSSLWDVFMDWSLMQNKSLLRDELVYPKWFYYFAIVTDVLLRFQWIFYALFSRQIQQSAVTSFCVGIAEVVRRIIWMFIRMENEHVTNIHLFRASREAPLPYGTITRAQRMEQQIPQAEPSRTEDVEAVSGYSPMADVSSLRRKSSIISPAVFRNVTKAIVNAHAKDFQRRKPKPADEENENSSDDDDNSDVDNS